MSDEVEVLEPNVAALAVRHTDATLVLPAAGGDALVRAFRAYEETCEALLNESDYQTFRERGKDQRFRKRSGWRKLAIAYAVTFEIVDHKIYPDPDKGSTEYAEFTVRATAPNGRFADGWGACSVDERCCDQGCSKSHDHCAAAKGEACPSKKHFTKPRHDIPATAETRAKNRAAADLFGMGEVSAEEVIGGTREQSDAKPENVTDHKCPSCGAAVIDNRDAPANAKGNFPPPWKCSSASCQGGGAKNDGGRWPWGTYDVGFFEPGGDGGDYGAPVETVTVSKPKPARVSKDEAERLWDAADPERPFTKEQK